MLEQAIVAFLFLGLIVSNMSLRRRLKEKQRMLDCLESVGIGPAKDDLKNL